MAGHSKWSTIKRKKGATDAKRGKIFTKCIHEISIAVKEGGADIDGNPRLRLAVDKAKSVNMPNDNIDRAIKRASGELKGGDLAELFYEGYGAGGAAIMVEAVTDNKNRTASEVRHAFSKCGGSLGESGCVAFLFDKKGLLAVKSEGVSEEEIMERAIEAGAEDVEAQDEFWAVTTDSTSFHSVKQELEAKYQFEIAELQMLPKTTVAVEGKEAEQVERLISMLDELDDVMNVYMNCELPE